MMKLDNYDGLDRQRFRTWQEYLNNSCKLMGERNGWRWLINETNAHYFVSPASEVVIKYGSDGDLFWKNLP